MALSWAGGSKLFVPRSGRCVQGELRVSGLSSLLVFGVPKMLSGGVVTAAMPLSHRGRPVTRVRRALPSFAGWPVSFIFWVDMVFLWREVSLFSFVPLWLW